MEGYSNRTDEKIPVLAVVGPTASGKSRLAAELARKYGGEVVSADSMQIYKGMDIGTAKVTPEETLGVPHHCIDFLEPSQTFSVAEYVRMAGACIQDIHARGKLPVLAGGTGLYVRTLLHGTQLSEGGGEEPTLREALREKAQREGGAALLEELRQFDPQSAERIHPNNIPRLIRAIEIYRTTGRTMTQQMEESHKIPSPYSALMLGLTFADREKLYDRINRRVDQMVESGLLEEARRFLESPEEKVTAMQAIGYKELAPYFADEIPLEEAVESIKRETRRYAKRQLTWFRRDPEIHWIEVDRFERWEDVLGCAEQIIGQERFLTS